MMTIRQNQGISTAEIPASEVQMPVRPPVELACWTSGSIDGVAMRDALAGRAVGGLALVGQQLVRLTVDYPAAVQAERLDARAPPAAGGSPPTSLAWM